MTTSPVTTAATNSITATGAAVSETVSKAGKSKDQFSTDFNSFLKIFLTQLQYQDPLAPQDAAAFTDQIATLTGVEQAVNTNKNLEELIAAVKAQNDSLTNHNAEVGTMASFVGKNVQLKDSSVTLEDGKNADISIVLEDLTKGAFISVTDTTGKEVFAGALEPNNGSYQWNKNNTDGYMLSADKYSTSWDGTDMQGNRLPKGTYNVSVTAKLVDKKDIFDDSGKVIDTVDSTEATTLVKGHVSGVNLEGKELTLLVNGKYIPLSQVTFIGE